MEGLHARIAPLYDPLPDVPCEGKIKQFRSYNNTHEVWRTFT